MSDGAKATVAEGEDAADETPKDNTSNHGQTDQPDGTLSCFRVRQVQFKSLQP